MFCIVFDTANDKREEFHCDLSYVLQHERLENILFFS